MATFEEDLAELEKVVSRLEAGGLPLEESVTLFEAGMRLSAACQERLASAESRMQKLIAPQRPGAVRTEDLALDDDMEGEDEESANFAEDDAEDE